jgi:pimeloyl-ACP methyl ester carboxylesterase
VGAERGGQIEVEGRRFSWHSVGAGPPLLLVNGYAATGADWDPTFLEALAGSFEVICPDNRGVGGSDLGTNVLTVDGMAADLEALIDALAIERLAVVGWSMGGFVAQALARRTPRRIASLSLLATDAGGPAATRAAAEAWARLIDRSGSEREQAARLIALLFPPELATEIDREFGEVVAAARAQLSSEALRAQEGAMDAWHGEDPPSGGDATNRLPVLIAHGDLDEVIPVANAELLAARWPGAEVELFPGCGHALMAQEPVRVAGLIHDGSSRLKRS